VVYELDESGHWIATVPAVKGCHTYGRSIYEAAERVREASGCFVCARNAGRGAGSGLLRSAATRS